MQVKVQLFKSFCIFFYNIGLYIYMGKLPRLLSQQVCFSHTWSVVLQICFCSWAYQVLTQFCTMREFVLLIICTFLIIVLCLCHAGCDMTAYMQCFCTCVCFHFFIVFLFCFSPLCICVWSIYFYGSPWSDSNKERKEKERKNSLNPPKSQSANFRDLEKVHNRTDTWLSKCKSVQISNMTKVSVH